MKHIGTLMSYAAILLGRNKYQLAPDGSDITLKPGKHGRLGGIVAAEDHDRIVGSNADGYNEVGICLYDFRRGASGVKLRESFPKLVQDFNSGLNSGDIADLCGMSLHAREGQAKDLELTQLVVAARRLAFNIEPKNEYCGKNCIKRWIEAQVLA